MLSIIIPTLNCRNDLAKTLDAMAMRPEDWDIIVSDGGSTDGTLEMAELAGARLVSGAKGRGPQLALGAEAATNEWYLFWHADTEPQIGWVRIVEDFIKRPENQFHAGYFRLVMNDPDPRARRVERLANWRAETFGLPYGDQGLLISSGFYEHLGGYQPMPMLEDVALVREIGPKRLHVLPTAAVTSAIRYQRDGWWARPVKNVTCLCLYFLGLPIDMITRFYR